MLRTILVFSLSTILSGFAVSASALDNGSSRYRSWGGDQNRLRELITELRTLIDQGERDRAADRRFLRDLRDLVAEFDNPWQHRAISDDFSDGDYQNQPSWQVISGHFEVLGNQGLLARTVQAAPPPPAPAAKEEKRNAGRDLAFALLSEILKKPDQASEPEPTDTAVVGSDEPAVIHLPAAITNSFKLAMSTQIRGDTGQYSIAVYQGGPDQAGYRLRLNHAPQTELVLERYNSRGTSTIDQARVPQEMGANIDLDWQRQADGSMRIHVNDAEVINTRDLGFKDPFSGISFASTQGDTLLRRISVDTE